MPTITVKNTPDDLYARLKQLARANHRSISREIIACIERTVYDHRLSPIILLARARHLREKTGNYLITGAEFTQAKIAGRP